MMMMNTHLSVAFSFAIVLNNKNGNKTV